MGELYNMLKAGAFRGGTGGGSGFTPTQEQLDAMNSGIDSEKVEQIGTNETNILSIGKEIDINLMTEKNEDLSIIEWYNKIPHPTTGIPTNSQTRICTDKIIIPQNIESITVEFTDTSHKIAFYLYDNDDALLWKKYWLSTSPLTIVLNGNEKKYIIGIAKQDNTVISTDDKSVVKKIHYNSVVKPYYIQGEQLQFELGTLNPATGNQSASNKRIVSQYVYLPKNTVIRTLFNLTRESYDESGQLIVYEFNNDKSYRSDSTWINNTLNQYTTSDDGYCRIILRKKDDTAISDADKLALTSKLVILPAYPLKPFNEIMYKEYIPSYYGIDTAAASIDTNSQNVGVNGITFGFATDIHWENDTHRASEIFKNLKNKNCDINYILLGGDYINGGTKTTSISNSKSAVDSFYDVGFDTFCIRGNHDNNSIPSGNTLITDAEFYSICQSKMPNSVVYGDYAYFYYDDTKTKTRFICLDSGTESTALSTAQGNWLDNVLSSTPESWHIIVAWHIVYGLASGTWSDVPLDLAPTTFSSAVFTKLDAHNSGGTSKVEAIIGGHCHCDKDYATTGGIPIILTDTASLYPLNGGAATRNTITETAVDVITIDYTNKTIKCVRIGRGSSRTINY